MWVPLVVAAVGLSGVLGAQLVAGWREDRRWAREVERDDLRWRRERERTADERRHTSRVEAYERVIGLLEAWAWTLYPAKTRVITEHGELTDDMRARLREVREQARDALGPINLHGPEAVRRMMRDAVVSKADFTEALLAGRPPDELRPMWELTKSTYYAMRAAMRRDLGIDPD